MGRSRVGLTSKIHAVVDTNGLPVRLGLTACEFAIAYAREGADVLISYLSEHEDAEETRRLVEEAGHKAVLVAGRCRIARALPGDRRKGCFGTRRHRPSRQ
jgi:hypothetical protein